MIEESSSILLSTLKILGVAWLLKLSILLVCQMQTEMLLFCPLARLMTSQLIYPITSHLHKLIF